MVNYYYTLKKTSKILSDDETKISREVISTDESDVETAIMKKLLTIKRQARYFKLMKNYNGDDNDKEALYRYLPACYKSYVYDLPYLMEQLASLYEIQQQYKICDIEVAPDCPGCLFDCPGQKDHMQCNIGCLHNPMTCDCCSRL